MSQPPEGWTAPGAQPAEEPAREAAPAPAASPPPGYGYGYGSPAPPPPPGYGQPPPPPGYGPPPPPPGYGPPPAPAYRQPPAGWQQGWGAPVVTPGVVPLRPLALGELLDGAVKVVRRYPRPTLGMSALVAVVTTVLNLLAVLVEDTSSFVDDVTATGSEDSFSTGLGAGGGLAGIPGAVVGLLGGLVLTGFLVSVVGKAVLGQPASFSETWQQVRPRLWALLGLALLVGLVCTVPMVVAVLVAVLLALASPVLLVIGIPLVFAAVVFGVYAYGRLSLSSGVLVLEKAGIREAMRRSGVLVKGSWWRVFGILLLVQVIASVVTSVLTVPFVLLAGFNAVQNPDTGSFTVLLVVAQIGSGLATFLVAPFSAGARSLLYVDRRMRAEGLDLTLQAAARG